LGRAVLGSDETAVDGRRGGGGGAHKRLRWWWHVDG
jgi:hypothetical protein